MADGDGTGEKTDKERALPLGSSSKFRAGVDAQLIELVRMRPVLYDCSHERFMDISLKNAIWNKIGKQLRANPSACKSRWYNIRDNYRRALRRPKHKMQYKFAYMLGFLHPHFRGEIVEDSLDNTNASRTKMENSEESNDSVFNSTVEIAIDEELQPSEGNDDADQSDDDPLSNPSESVVDYHFSDKAESVSDSVGPAKVSEFFPSAKISGSFPSAKASGSLPSAKASGSFPSAKVRASFPSANVTGSFPSANVSGSYPSNSSQSSAVDAFMAAISPSLKELSPYHLSLAKAEIFAAVHKYELKGIVESGWAPKGVNPLP